MTTTRIRILAPFLLALVALLAVSCGGSDETAIVTDPSSDDTAADAADESDDTGAEPDESDSTAGSVETYCRMKAAGEALLDEADPFDPELIEAAVRENVELLGTAIDIAPDEIRDDLRAIRRGFDDYVAALEDNDWDFFAASPALEELSARPELEAAGDRIDAWEEANCDFADDEVDDEGAFEEDPFSTPEALEMLLSSEAGRAMMIESMTEDGEVTADQAECLLDNLDFDALSALATEAEPSPEVFALFFEVAALCSVEDLFGFGEMDDADDAGMSLDAEMLEAMLGTEAGRAIFIEGFVAETGVTVAQAECLVDNLDTEILAMLAENQQPAPEAIVELLQVLDTCGLTGELFSG